MPFDWFTSRPARPAPAAPAAPRMATSPAAEPTHADQLRAAALRITREDAGTPIVAPVPAAATVTPMPTWTPGSRFGMCRDPRDTTR
jgi:hypothetical protein